ncbi:MAG: hypothetical protein L0I93_06940, partial [Atopostipes suicloacalis]|nr:hypothetical protein [Atopostipes suicloacalis]
MKNNLKDFIQLTNFEFERMSKFLFGLMGFTLITNLIAYIYLPFQYMRNVNEYMTSNSATIKEALEIFPLFSFYDLTNSLWIIGPILIGISGLLFYAVFTWYREWLGKNTFAYRLFMLPISRMTIFFSKLVNIFIGIFALIASQMISLGMGYPIVAMIVDQDFLSNLSLIESVRMNMGFHYFLPFQPSFFLAVNGAGLVFLILLFTFILLERSFGIKGIIFGIVYAIFSVLIILFPLFISNLFKNYYILFESETI